MGFVQVSRESVAGAPTAVQEANNGPQWKENRESQRKPEEEPFVERDGVSLREIALPHPSQYEVDTCPCEGAHPSDCGGVCDPQHDGPAELADDVGLAWPHREALEDSGGHRHHQHGRRHVVHPHADERRRGTYTQQQQRWVHWVPAK